IRRVREVYWLQELGIAQAMWVLEVERLGPFLVEGDRAGRSLFALANREIDLRLGAGYARLPPYAMGRFRETTARGDEVVQAAPSRAPRRAGNVIHGTAPALGVALRIHAERPQREQPDDEEERPPRPAREEPASRRDQRRADEHAPAVTLEPLREVQIFH